MSPGAWQRPSRAERLVEFGDQRGQLVEQEPIGSPTSRGLFDDLSQSLQARVGIDHSHGSGFGCLTTASLDVGTPGRELIGLGVQEAPVKAALLFNTPAR